MKYQGFLSYSSLDHKDPKKWVQIFQEKLQLRLSVKRGKNSDIFYDKLDHILKDTDRDSSAISKELKDRLEKSEILVGIMSPSYFNSKYCELERDYFLDQKGRDKRQIIKVLKLRPEYTNYPQDLRELETFIFHEGDNELNPITNAYRDELQRLVNHLKSLLDNTTRIYIAKTPTVDNEDDDIHISKNIDVVRKEFRTNFQILPHGELDNFEDPIKLKQYINEELQEAKFSIHWLNSDLIKKTSALEYIQFEEAMEVAKRNSNHLLIVWNHKKEKEFIEEIGKKLSDNQIYNFDLIEKDSPQDFIEAVKEKFSK